MSLRIKLLLAALGVQAAFFAAWLVVGHALLQDAVLEEARKDVAVDQRLLVKVVAPLLATRDYAALQALASELAEVSALAYLTVEDTEGRPVAAAGQGEPPRVEAPAGESGRPIGHVVHTAAPIALGGVTYGRLRFGVSIEPVLQTAERLRSQAMAVGMAGFGASALVLLLVAGALTRRLRTLSEAAQRFGQGHENVIVPVAGHDEVAQLATTFNRMSRELSARIAALRESEERQRALVDALAEGVVFLDERGKVLACNDAAPRILGLPRERLIGCEPQDSPLRFESRDGQPLPAAEHPSAVALRTGRPQRDFVASLRRPDGTQAWLSVNAMPLVRPGEGRPYAAVTSFADITTLVAAQMQLRQVNAELEQRVAARTRELVDALEVAQRASRAKSEFLSRMSHELRTPLNAILGFAQVLQLKPDALPAAARDPIRQIESAGWHLLELINDVLDLSRIESGTMTVSREPIDVAALLAECARLAEPLARKHEVKLDHRAADGPALHALGDRTRLKQVVMNLLSNAIKYNRAGGSVTVSVAPAADGWVEIAVADTGRGFTEAQLQQLFQPFNRLGAEKGPVEGTGIGLVISKRLVELMRGTLQVQTTAGVGSVFTVRLPAAAGDAASAQRPAPALPQSSSGRAHTVLYIEDNPSNVDLLAGVLALRPGIRLITAENGAKGLALARSERPDLVLIDVALPDIDGVELCRRLRAEAGFERVPLIALSAHAMPGDVQRGLAAGFSAYLTKPLDVPAFLAELDRRLAGTQTP